MGAEWIKALQEKAQREAEDISLAEVLHLIEEDDKTVFEERVFNENAEKCPRRKTLAVITNSMAKTQRAEMLSLLTVELADRGWDITIITDNRQGFFDFLVDERVHRFSMDKAYHKETEWPEILKNFVETHPEIDHYLFWEPRMKTFAEDYLVIRQQEKHRFVFFRDCINEAFTNAGARNKVMARVWDCDAAISAFPPDRILYKTTFIPYLHSHALEDVSAVQLGEKELLLLTAGSSARTMFIVYNFVQLLQKEESFRDKVLRIVPIEKELQEDDLEDYSALAELFPENIILEPLCPKPHKILNGHAGLILVHNYREYPDILSVAVAKGLPTVFAKDYSDYEIQNFNKGFTICDTNDTEAVKAQLRAFFDAESNQRRAENTRQAVNAETRKEILDRWEAVLLGKEVEEYSFASEESILSSAMDYAKHIGNVWMEKHHKADLDNRNPYVEKAKLKAAAAKENWRYPIARLRTLIRQNVRKLIIVYKRWERNTFLWRSYIDTDMATRKKVQLLILKAFIEFDRICRENNLRYYLAGGTLLGAVRHKGFIPWDDDMDVTMPREDYDKFLKICPEQLREGFHLNAHAYPYTFTRLEVLGPRTTAPLQRKGRNIFVDILPLDCVAPDEKKQLKHGKRSDFLRLNMMRGAKMLCPITWRGRYDVLQRLLWKIFCPYSIMIRKWTRNAKKYQSDKATHWVCLPGDYGYEGESFPVEYWGEPVMMEFEGLTVPCMNQWEAYLVAHYGEYMLAPPVSQRSLKHKIYSLDLERYTNMSLEDMAKEVSDDYFATTGKRVSFFQKSE